MTTNIEWARNADGSQGRSWNLVVGCSVKSTGCKHCYAMKGAWRMASNKATPQYHGLTKMVNGNPVWTGEVRLVDHKVREPLERQKPTTWFVNSMSDLFHEGLSDETIDKAFAIMAMCPQHTFQIVTKRSGRMRAYFDAIAAEQRAAGEDETFAPRRLDRVACDLSDSPCAAGLIEDRPWPLPNVWLIVSTERQQEADERIPDLLATPAAVRGVSVEPMLSAVDLERVTVHVEGEPSEYFHYLNALTGEIYDDENGAIVGAYEPGKAPKLDWVIVGGESGDDARPMHPAWVVQLRSQCSSAGTSFFFKQWGEWVPVCAMSEDLMDSIYHPAPVRDPEATRRCKVDCLVLHADASQHRDLSFMAFAAGTGAMTMFKVGKAKAGRQLFGIEHNGMPPITPATDGALL